MLCESRGNSLQIHVDYNFIYSWLAPELTHRVACYQFAANCDSKSSTLETKVHLMDEIALEFSIKWDSKAFGQRMSKPSAFPQVLFYISFQFSNYFCLENEYFCKSYSTLLIFQFGFKIFLLYIIYGFHNATCFRALLN